jgi:hypothetical protein
VTLHRGATPGAGRELRSGTLTWRRGFEARLCGAAVVTFGLLALPKPAHAIGPVDIEVGAKIGGATDLPNDVVKSLGVGMGARAGASFRGFYGGVSLLYYFGQPFEINQGDAVPSSVSSHGLQLGFEFGYGVKVSILTLRPQVGLGNLEILSDSVGALELGFTNSETGFLYVEPGLVALATFGMVFVGVDINALLVPAGPSAVLGAHSFDACFNAHGQMGLKF